MDVRSGKWEPVRLREAWPTEDRDFTHWLARPEQLGSLGEALGVEMELVGVEQPVGSFRADILCRNKSDGTAVIIENQLEPTDHSHLGQLLTYAAGHEAITIVWVAEHIRHEHGTTLDWLNARTDEKANLFGVEVEVWRLGEVVTATFRVVRHPGGATTSAPGAGPPIKRAPRERARRPGVSSPPSLDSLTPAAQLRVEYWTALKEVVGTRPGPLRAPSPGPESWYGFGVGRSHFALYAVAYGGGDDIHIDLNVRGPQRIPHFRMLHAQKSEIESDLGEQLEWLELPNMKISRIILRRPGSDIEDRTDWSAQHQWLLEKLEDFHRVFVPRIRALD